MRDIGYVLILAGLSSEIYGVFLVGSEYLPISFRDYLFDPIIASWYCLIGKPYPFESYGGFNNPNVGRVVKGLFFVSGGFLLQLIGSVLQWWVGSGFSELCSS